MDEAFVKEMALRRDMSKLESEAEEAIAVEEANIASSDAQEGTLDFPPVSGPELALALILDARGL